MPSDKINRYVPLLAWILVIVTLLVIPAKILSYGYLPSDDALRHAAKAVSGKPWQEILVMRPDFPLDIHPGWHALLGALYHWQHCTTETLVVVSVFGLAFLVGLSALPWLRWPEAWVVALLAGGLLVPLFLERLLMGRPFLLTIAAYVTLLAVWSRIFQRRPQAWEMAATLALIAAAAWIHGSFYLLLLPAAGLLLAGRWRQACWFGACWALGSFLGASLTGHPVQFLAQSVRVPLDALGAHTLARQLVTEFQPSSGDVVAVVALAALIIWRARSADWKPQELVEPVFLTGVIGWVLGLAVTRFWLDWGLPAFLLWSALQLQKQFQRTLPFDSPKRLLFTAVAAFALYLGTTSDLKSRWTWNLTNEYLTQDNPALAGWLPADHGILYSADERVFYETFFKNPTAPWRYVLGFEAALMRPDDLDVMRSFYWNRGDVRAYQPWVKKMQSGDRLVVRASWLPTAGPPNIPQLEWRLAVRDLWIGRPRSGTNAAPAHVQGR